jgi:farnesyl diphosphate synthase
MIGGQVLDIEAETSAPDADEIRILQSMKTGALIRFACEAGAVLGGASKEERQNMADFGKTIGLAFQLADDLLDVTSSSEDMGKRVGKDAEQGKGTLVGLYGIEKTRSLLNESLNEAEVLLRPFGDKADILRQTARFVVERSN